jgi:hypothetical protein
MIAAVTARGALQHQYGVDLSIISWVESLHQKHPLLRSSRASSLRPVAAGQEQARLHLLELDRELKGLVS